MLKYPSSITLLFLPGATALLNLSVYLFPSIFILLLHRYVPLNNMPHLSSLALILNTSPKLLKVTNDLGASKFKEYFYLLILAALCSSPVAFSFTISKASTPWFTLSLQTTLISSPCSSSSALPQNVGMPHGSVKVPLISIYTLSLGYLLQF